MSRFYTPENTLQAKLEKCQAAPPGFEPVPGKQKVPGSNPGGAA